jgi:hypothetical protein
MILDALKKRLHKNEQKHPGKWLKELPAVVWGLHTQPSCNTGVSPYFMVFGAEAQPTRWHRGRVEQLGTDREDSTRTPRRG